MFHSSPTTATVRRPITSGGFGLVELMVAIGVMVLVTTVVVVRQSSFNSIVMLENQAYEVASDIRAVQVQAVSTQNIDTSGSDTASYRQSLGVRLEEGDQQYDFVRETPDGNRFGTGGRLDRRFEITDIVAYDGSGSEVGYDGNGVAVMFTRPNFDAHFFELVSPYEELDAEASSVRISVQALEDDTRTRDIVVTSTGQVTVSKPVTP